MEYRDLVDSLDPALVDRLRRAVETGRWPDGRAVSAEQRESSLQAIIAWEAARLPEDERTGFIDRGRKGSAATADTVRPLRWDGGVDDGGESGSGAR